MVKRLIYYQLFLILHTALLCSSNRPCLTWKIQEENMELICRITGFSHPVSIIDNQGKLYANCTFTIKDYNCTPLRRQDLIEVDFSKKYIVIKAIKVDANMSGIWVCSQDNIRVTTEVSLSKGIVDSTEIFFTGTALITEGHNMKHVLNCFSCREPDHRNVEFLIDGRTEDSITYHETGNCTHYKGECHPDECSCNGNMFRRAFQFESKNKSISYTCDMVFTDSLTNAKFSKLVSVVFDGEGFSNESESTTIIKPADMMWNSTITSDDRIENVTESNRTPITTVADIQVKKKDEFFVPVLIGLGCIVICIIFLYSFICYKRRKALEHKRRIKETEDNTALFEDDVFEQVPSSSDIMSPVFCGPCKSQSIQRASVFFCIDCEEAHCGVCSAKHNISEQTANHKSHIMNMVAKNVLSVLTCVSHNRRMFQYHCMRHDVMCCIECKTVDHVEGCILLKLESDLENVLESPDQISFGFQLDQCIDTLIAVGKYLYVKDDQIAQKRSSGIRYTSSSSEIKINVITTKQNTYALRVEKFITVMREQKDVFDFITKNGSERQLFIVKHSLNQRLNEINKTVFEVLHFDKDSITNVNELQKNRVETLKMTNIIYKELKNISLS